MLDCKVGHLLYWQKITITNKLSTYDVQSWYRLKTCIILKYHIDDIRVQPTVKLLKLSGVQGSDGIWHTWSFADSVGVDGSHSKVVGVSFEEPRHWVFTDLNGVVVALGPVLSSNFAPMKIYNDRREQKETLKGGNKTHPKVAMVCCEVATCRKGFWLDAKTFWSSSGEHSGHWHEIPQARCVVNIKQTELRMKIDSQQISFGL